MSRTFSHIADDAARTHLNALLEAARVHDTSKYQQIMTDLGRDMGKALTPKLVPNRRVLLVCTVEDADFLARGIMDALSAKFSPPELLLACFWNDRRKLGERHPIDVAPIIHRYMEPIGDAKIDAVIVTKSIIRGGCVIRTNLSEVLDLTKPRQIFIAAPVMLEGASAVLNAEFPKRISTKFQYMFFAEDSERVGDDVLPGVGGSVYELLGLGNQQAKNRYRPNLIAERIAQHTQQAA